jgi:pSer/pThr/pTyr-binding forkhead associated (FHA) protein
LVRQPYLVGVAGFGIGRVFPIKERTQIGRDPDGDVVLPYWTVSWRHLMVSFRDGVVVAEDLGSRNGTFVGVDKIKRRELAEGDVLAIGDSIVLKLVYASHGGVPGAAEAYQLPRDQVTGVANAASLLDRLRVEQAEMAGQGDPIILVFFRFDGVDGFDELSLVEDAMRQVAIVVLQSMKGETLLARSADGEFIAMARAPAEKVRKMAADACSRLRRQLGKRFEPASFSLTAAVVPVATTSAVEPEAVLKLAREKAYLALARVPAGVVATTPLTDPGGE